MNTANTEGLKTALQNVRDHPCNASFQHLEAVHQSIKLNSIASDCDCDLSDDDIHQTEAEIVVKDDKFSSLNDYIVNY